MSERDRRTLMIGGGVVAVLLVGFLLFNVLGGGGEEAAQPESPGGATGPAPTTQTPSPTISASPVISFTGRDPFSIPPALNTATATSTSTSTASTTATSTSTASTTATSTSTSTASATATPTAPSNGSSTSVGGRTVVLLDTYESGGVEKATVEVDGTVYTVRQGELFAGGAFRLTAVDGDCATFLYGDQQFTLCVNPSK